ncbi:hypothetical protein KFE25_010572 [Diacronema lutheri]|uniref:Uncharacterized protein n=1 Tax=Diacronema lutheri TaxID=2081491 RepID=A0A8J5XEK4_DIALT|nr:hypothetical protein KFE25_010572 [Diacronema lutheri]
MASRPTNLRSSADARLPAQPRAAGLPAQQQVAQRVLDSLDWMLRQHIEAMKRSDVEFAVDDRLRASTAAGLCEQLAALLRARLPPDAGEFSGDGGCMLPNGIANALHELLRDGDGAWSSFAEC